MQLNEFKNCVRKTLQSYGFEKNKNRYYRKGNGFLCEIRVFKSNYGPMYYFEYTFFLGDYQKPYVIVIENFQNCPPFVAGRFYFPQEDCYSFEYPDYTESELTTFINTNMEKVILPPFSLGKKFLADNFGTIYGTPLDPEEIRKLLAE